MSVYTSLSRVQIEQFLNTYNLQPLISYAGISAGIENSNYLLTTPHGQFVLTLYEHLNSEEIKPYLELLIQLGQSGSYFPNPLADRQQNHLSILAERPAALFKCLPGESVLQVTLNQCQLVASALASLHLTNPSIAFSKENPRNIEWMQATAFELGAFLSAEDATLLEDELNFQLTALTQDLSQGLIHADLFKDNVLFVGNRLTGMLDFYAACCDCYLLDVAITLNDWCVDQHGVFDRKRQEVFMQAYKQVRDIPQQEEKWLPLMLRRACLRFWLSRLEHKLNPRPGEMTQEKDPERFKNLLLQQRAFDALR